MKVFDFIQALKEIAPPELAEEWDNTGVLIDQTRPRKIEKVLLTIDLTKTVTDEAIRLNVDAIISYHPLFFGGLKNIRKCNPQSHNAMRLIQKNITVYSPHTALDDAPKGVNDWLASFFVGKVSTDGLARVVKLEKKCSILAISKIIKQKLRLKNIQIASTGKEVKTIAICAGSGIEALRTAKADCYFTGEMKHHDVLGAVERGTSVILCGHTETERGYLKILQQRLKKEGLEIFISKDDKAPLKLV